MSAYGNIEVRAAVVQSPMVCYMILPRGLKEDGISFIEAAAAKYGMSLVVLSGMDWNNDLTPWPAGPVFKKDKPFGGSCETFLTRLESELIPQIEEDLGIIAQQRSLLGVSLSGLFAMWAATRTTLFSGIASISGSFWYDDFAPWFCNQSLSERVERVFACIGNREKDTKNPHMGSVQSCTEIIVDSLRSRGVDIDYQIFEGTHFSPIIPRLELALESLSR